MFSFADLLILERSVHTVLRCVSADSPSCSFDRSRGSGPRPKWFRTVEMQYLHLKIPNLPFGPGTGGIATLIAVGRGPRVSILGGVRAAWRQWNMPHANTELPITEPTQTRRQPSILSDAFPNRLHHTDAMQLH